MALMHKGVAVSPGVVVGVAHRVDSVFGSAEADIFKTHLQIVNDEAMLAKVRLLIESQRLTALSAVQEVLQGYAASFARIEQDYFRERVADLRDVVSRIGSHLTVHVPGHVPHIAPGIDGNEP